MEIDKAIRECDDGRLRTKYNNSIYVIQRALSLYSIEEVAFSFNGGKDSTVLLHLLRAGYFLHDGGQNSRNGSLKDFPIRTIYFESPCAFPEINSFTHDTAAIYGLQIDNICLDFKSGLEALLKNKPIRAIFLGVRIGDPTAIGQEQFSPSSPGWPPFMRVNPILDWSYRDVWAFLLTCKVQYCSLYDQGYTSIGSTHDTVPNALLSIGNSSNEFKPAYMLSDGRLERAGRAKKSSIWRQIPANSNGLNSLDLHKTRLLTASVIVVGAEILFGTVEDQLGPSLCRKLHSVGWSVSQVSVVHNNIDSLAEEVERQKSTCDMVTICGGVGPLHSDVTLAGIAKAFGVRLAPDENFEEYLRHTIGDQCNGDWNKMAQLPEGITELLHHDKLSMPLIKCQNVVVLCATDALELEEEWDCLIELTKSSDLFALLKAYVSKNVTTNLSDAEIAQPLTKLCLECPDLYIGCYRKSRYGPLVISFTGKEQAGIESAVKALHEKFGSDAFMDID
ncbi:FAD synthase isoform X2 [Neltuma alba]|uniref:FAD synthase isoform X2 n=1 Tax=Neltuma alba TaxID=207710 RepID=UPI0010A332CA|nr:FAD synthase-like isoform X2 [Prosopis alba]XP_028797924.1 FAD synthase-like isoform X2 [Prosopis alba]